jgi:hypothetical protein
MASAGATVQPWCVQVESSAVSLPPLWVISRMRPVGSLTETDESLGIFERATNPVAAAPEVAALELAGADGADEPPESWVPVVAGAVDPELLEPPPHAAATSATPPTLAPSNT